MISHWQRRFYYALTNPVMWLNGRVYRLFRAPKSPIKVHFGPGKMNYLPGWFNVDANVLTAQIDLWANIEHALPFRNETVLAFYSHHVMEHIAHARIRRLFGEMHRCLRPGCPVRIAVPDVGNAARAYAAGDIGWFPDLQPSYESLGGRFARFALCLGEHRQMFDFSLMEELLLEAGFEEIKVLLSGKTRFPEVFDAVVLGLENESCPELPHTLVVEGVKP